MAMPIRHCLSNALLGNYFMLDCASGPGQVASLTAFSDAACEEVDDQDFGEWARQDLNECANGITLTCLDGGAGPVIPTSAGPTAAPAPFPTRAYRPFPTAGAHPFPTAGAQPTPLPTDPPRVRAQLGVLVVMAIGFMIALVCALGLGAVALRCLKGRYRGAGAYFDVMASGVEMQDGRPVVSSGEEDMDIAIAPAAARGDLAVPSPIHVESIKV
jgi:hypothetical protein